MEGECLHHPDVRVQCRSLVYEVISGVIGREDNGGDSAVEVSDRDRNLENSDAVVVSGLLSFATDPVPVSRLGGENDLKSNLKNYQLQNIYI